MRDGSPPQTNIVHVDGNRSVLMVVLKAGGVSTLSIIDGVKKKIEEIRPTLPSNLKLTPIGDQSLFINALATVQATVHLTQSDTPEGLKQAIEGRIQAPSQRRLIRRCCP